MKLKFSLLFSSLCICGLFAFGQSDTQIKAVFRKFQEGYHKRDTAMAQRFAEEICAKDIKIIGTGEDEWFEGISSAKHLFKSDWAYWFTLSIDTSSIALITLENTAFFVVDGIASMSFANKEAAYNFAIDRLQNTVKNEKDNRKKLLAYSSQSSDLIQQIESGGLEVKYSVRLSGGLVKQDDKWLFQQLVFSFPYPMARK
jgi:hypothetical protein